MSRHSFRLLGLLLALAGTCAHAAWERTGQTPSGAVYRMAVPEGWRAGDGLVVYQHDLSFEVDLDPDLGPLASLQLEQGYAVVASGYSQAGWAVFASGRDNAELVERFRQDVGEPGTVLSYGTAMGGFIALQMAQEPHVAVDGVLALCPLTAGHQRWEAALDVRVVYDAICADVPGGALPAAADRPWLLDGDRISADGLADIITRTQQCFGLGSAMPARDPGQQRRLDLFQQYTGLIDEAAVLPQLAFATLGLSDLVRDRGKLAGAAAIGNRHVDYGDSDLNAVVQRVDTDAFAALDFRLRAGLHAHGQARVLSLHGNADALATRVDQTWLGTHWPSDRLVSVTVASGQPVGCGLSAPELRAGWDSLRAWLADIDGAVPDTVDIQARCLELVDAGGERGDCRIDAEAANDLTAPIPRDRGAAVAQLDARFSGDWRDPDHPDDVWALELLDGDRALLYGLTFPAVGAQGDQFWLIGTGRVSDDGIAFDDVHSLQGGGFGADFDAGQATVRPWGSVRVVFDECGMARLRYQAVAPYGSGERRLSQTRGLAGKDCHAGERVATTDGLVALSGSWYDPQRPGQGVVVNIDPAGGATVAVMSYDPRDGQPVWLHGRGQVDSFGRARFVRVQRPMGHPFDTPAARPSTPVHWGRIEIDFPDCQTAVLRYRGDDPVWGSGRLTLARLTRPLGLGDCGL